MKSKAEINEILIKHIDKIDRDIDESQKSIRAELYKAKSTALLALVELKK
ncbi:hypothetical protein [Niallia taxi]